MVDLCRRLVWAKSELVALTRTELHLLAYLMQNSDRQVTKDEIIGNVFGTHHRPSSSLLSVHLCHLRQKLGEAADPIVTLRGRGLRFDAAVAVETGDPSNGSIGGM